MKQAEGKSNKVRQYTIYKPGIIKALVQANSAEEAEETVETYLANTYGEEDNPKLLYWLDLTVYDELKPRPTFDMLMKKGIACVKDFPIST